MRIKLKVIILFSLITLLVYLWVPSTKFDVVQAEGEKADSTIGGIVVTGMDEEEIRIALDAAIATWKQNGDFVVQGGGVDLPLNKDYFEFDVNATMNQYVNSTSKAWYAFWKSENTLNLPLTLTVNPEVNTEIDSVSLFVLEETYQNVVNEASYLSDQPVEATVTDLSIYEANRIAFTLENFDGNVAELTNITSQLNDTIISSGEIYSLLEHVETAEAYTLNFIASMLYSVVLQTDYEIAERNSQNLLPNYLTAGIEAKVNRDLDQDLKFINHTSAPSKLKMSVEGNTVKMEIYTVPTDSEVTYFVTDKQEVTPRTIYRYSNDLAMGKEELIQEGKPGLRVSVYRTILGEDKLVSKDFYPPVNRIIVKSSKQPNVETPTTDPDLTIDLNGDGLPDYIESENNQTSENNKLPENSQTSENNKTPESSQTTSNSNTPNTETNVNEDGLPEGMQYDKAGNIIPIESQS